MLDQNVADHGSLLGFQIVLTDLSLFVLIFFICTGEFDINERDIPIIPFALVSRDFKSKETSGDQTGRVSNSNMTKWSPIRSVYHTSD